MNEPPVGSTARIDIGGRALNVWTAGESGPVLLFVHGIPTNHLLWHDVVVGLQPRARVVAVDMLGYGWSDRPNGWRVDIASQAEYVLRLLDALELERVTYIGHDLGGGVGQILAVTNPQRIEAMVIIDGVAFDGWPVPLLKAMKLSWPVIDRVPADLAVATLRKVLRGLFARPSAADAFIPRFVRPWGGPQHPGVLVDHLRSLDSVYTETMAPFLPRLQMPVEVMWGRRDSQMKPRYGEMLARAIPNARLTWVDDAAHFVPADAPSDVVDGVLRAVQRRGNAAAGP